MTTDQALLIALIAAILGMLLWGRFRHDLVAAAGLMAAVVLGFVPQDKAFSGFSNPAVIIVALVLVASRAIENSGALARVSQWVVKEKRSTGGHIAVTGSIAAALSAVINNVAALALFMPMDIQAAQKAGRPPSLTLMALSFATILGGMITLIGTPPNIIASAIRQQELGEPYGMFAFTPVGVAVAGAGILFIALFGWRLVPRREDKAGALAMGSTFEAELFVPPDAPAVGKSTAEVEAETDKADVLLIGLIRHGIHSGIVGRIIAPEDLLIVRGSTDAIAKFIKAMGLRDITASEDEAPDASEPGDEAERKKPAEAARARQEIVEVVVHATARLADRSAIGFDLSRRFGITVLGIARAGELRREKIGRRLIKPGDVLLLSGPGARSKATLELLGLIPINRVSVSPVRPADIALAAGLFAGAVTVATFGLLSFTVAIAIAVMAYAALGLVPAREFYEQIDWSVVVMLACLLPIGTAFADVGGTGLVASGIARWTDGQSPVLALVILMVVTMTLSDVLNNVATMVISGPIAIDLAQRLEVNPDTFLMGVAIAASCAFLSPIGHKNNTLIMGPGGFRFGDYWRMGLPLELIVLTVSIPMLLIVWPL